MDKETKEVLKEMQEQIYNLRIDIYDLMHTVDKVGLELNKATKVKGFNEMTKESFLNNFDKQLAQYDKCVKSYQSNLAKIEAL